MQRRCTIIRSQVFDRKKSFMKQKVRTKTNWEKWKKNVKMPKSFIMCFKWLQFGAMVVPCKKLLTFLLLRSLIQLLYLTVQTLARSNELFLWLFAVGGPLLFLIQVRGRSWMTSRDLQGRTVCKFCRKSSSYFQPLPPPTANTSLISYRPNVKLFDYFWAISESKCNFPLKIHK